MPGAAAALAGSQPGGAVLAALLCGQQRLQAQGECNDTLGVLLCHLCLDLELLGPVLLSLGEPAAADVGRRDAGAAAAGAHAAAPPLAAAHALLLQELAAEAQGVPSSSPGEAPGRTGAAMRALLDLARRLASAAGGAPQGPAAAQQVLQDALQLLRDLAARDDGGAALAGGGDLVAELAAAGGVRALLAALRALGPVRDARRRDAGDPAAEFAGVAPALREEAARFACDPPYEGYRTDLLSGAGGMQWLAFLLLNAGPHALWLQFTAVPP